MTLWLVDSAASPSVPASAEQKPAGRVVPVPLTASAPDFCDANASASMWTSPMSGSVRFTEGVDAVNFKAGNGKSGRDLWQRPGIPPVFNQAMPRCAAPRCYLLQVGTLAQLPLYRAVIFCPALLPCAPTASD
jgi:hypothetical protein